MLGVVGGTNTPVINTCEDLIGEVEKCFTNLDVKGRLLKCKFHHFGGDLYGSASSRIMGSCEDLRQM
jgi:hypothetical protein